MTRRLLITAVLVLHGAGIAEACGRCRPRPARRQQVTCPPPVTYQTPVYQATAVASPQSAYALPSVPAQSPVAYAVPTAAEAPPAGVQPLYNYAAARPGSVGVLLHLRRLGQASRQSSGWTSCSAAAWLKACPGRPCP